ncbi:hypothetical protein [Shimazuella alba]|uniref:Uncharacterized protein n=1 Tax=Shimazuella alba TaxID=2690964 RepID=A0A6I4VM36_9BACL|nr:hypothetical protein [Shimazuella alba]MXQ52487.1 hypothetical protein [Shimazuella alba]
MEKYTPAQKVLFDGAVQSVQDVLSMYVDNGSVCDIALLAMRVRPWIRITVEKRATLMDLRLNAEMMNGITEDVCIAGFRNSKAPVISAAAEKEYQRVMGE